MTRSEDRPFTTNRRSLLRGGLGALGYGALGLAGAGVSAPFASAARARGPAAGPSASPFLHLDPLPPSHVVNGLPFARWFTGDDFTPTGGIPFHTSFAGPFPAPEETIDVAVVGGGLSGLCAAHALRHRHPALFELRPRFGGNALGEAWRETRYSLGSAYVITTDKGSTLDRLYSSLGLYDAVRESYPPDPVEIGGEIDPKYWSGAGLSSSEVRHFARYAEVVAQVAEYEYPEIPLTGDPGADEIVRRLDTLNFREDLERRMGVPLLPRLAAAIQAYFYSSFGVGMEFISAAAGWNFVAAEEYGRLVFPGGNASMAEAFWRDLDEVERSGHPPHRMLRPSSRVVDVRRVADNYRVTWVDASEQVRALDARRVVMAGAKQIAKYMLPDLETAAPKTFDAMASVETMAYAVANVLLDAPLDRDFYDLFLVGDENIFPMTPGAAEARSRPADVLNGNYALPNGTPRSALTLYWPLPWFTARFSLLAGTPYEDYAAASGEPVRFALRLLGIPESAVRQIRLTRWGHAMPLAAPHFIADGHAEQFLAPYDGGIHFANQDNWALPAVENSLLDALRVATEIDDALG